MRRLLSLGCFAGLLAGLSGWSTGAVVYSYGTDSGSYTGAAGSIVPVNIYLNEALSGGSSSYINANGGLTGAGAAINVVSTAGGAAASFGSGNATFTGNSTSFGVQPIKGQTLFYNQGSGAQANNLEFVEDISSSQTGVQQSGGQVYLGTLDVQVGSGTTTYELTSLGNDTIDNSNSSLGQTNGNTVTVDPSPFGSDLDVTPASGAYTGANDAPLYEFTVSPTTSPVPEPASIAVFGIGAVGLVVRRRRAVVSCD